jgi:hypothetical protein
MPGRRAAIASIFTALALLTAYAVLSNLPRAKSSEAAVVMAPAQAECREATMIAPLAGLREASGLTTSRKNPDLLWSHNDSADATVFGVGHDGTIKARVHVTGAAVDDWEAVTTGPCSRGSCLYVGDIGDNNGVRPRITIYRTTEPALTDSATEPVETYVATYPEGPRDAEALFATSDGSLYIVTKGEGAPVSIYRVPALTAGTVLSLQRIGTLTSETSKTNRITDAALSPDGTWVALRTNTRLLFYKTADVTSGSLGSPKAFDLQALNEPQGEGIAWARDNILYLAGEGGRGGTLARVSCTVN